MAFPMSGILINEFCAVSAILCYLCAYMNLPNALTIARIFLVPVVVTVLLANDRAIPERTIWGASLFLLAALTDMLDGYLARRRGQVTTLGRLLDPIADKLLISSALIALVWRHIAAPWMVVVIIGREFAVSGLRSIAAHEGFSIDVSRMGKGKMVMQVAAVVGLILGEKYHGWVEKTAVVLLWAVVFFALVSMAQYFIEFWKKTGRHNKPGATESGNVPPANQSSPGAP